MAKPPRHTPATDGDLDAFLAKVQSAPKPVPSGQRGRLIFALDATMSREPTWDVACDIQSTMFNTAASIGGLDVQLVYFRGFRECRAGKWQPDARGLGRLMAQVQCQAGRTQIGRVLSHILKEADQAKVGAAIYVGDAFEEDIDAVCHTAGELGLHGVPVFVFQEGYDALATKAFKEIARLTGGAWCPFDLSAPDRLKMLLSAVAAYAAGGMPALEDYSKSQGGEAVALLTQMRGGRK